MTALYDSIGRTLTCAHCPHSVRAVFRVAQNQVRAHHLSEGHARIPNYTEASLLLVSLEKRPRIRGPIRRKRMPDAGDKGALDEFLPTTIV
jgi:hypothetical protein